MKKALGFNYPNVRIVQTRGVPGLQGWRASARRSWRRGSPATADQKAAIKQYYRDDARIPAAT